MAIASAGVVLDEEVINSNLPWRISLPEMRRELHLRDLHVINDFDAAAHGRTCLDPADSRLLTPGVETAAPGPALVIGPGTGLGAGDLHPASARHRGAADRGRHDRLRARQRRARSKSCAGCSSARAMSRPNNSFPAPAWSTCTKRSARSTAPTPALRAPAAISEAARRGDAMARDAVLTFCALLGSVIGDLAVIGSARSVFVAGGIVPQLTDFLPGSDFRARLVDKGAMRAVLERVPVRLIENERLGVIGAASWYLQHLKDRTDNPADARTRRDAHNRNGPRFRIGGWEPTGQQLQPVGGDHQCNFEKQFFR